MEISRNLAHQIVTNIKGIIKQDLNFMDKNGIIIASTDLDRIDTFHEAARECVKRKKTIIIEYDNQYRGSKKGINIPVEFEQVIVGVIGITGNSEEVTPYGTIIKKMTEILLKEDWIKENEIRRRDNYRNFLEGIIYNRFEDNNLINVTNENKSKMFAISKPVFTYLESEDIEKILNLLDTHFYNDNDIMYSFVYQDLVILFSDKSKQSVIRYLREITRNCKEMLKLEIKFGISDEFIDFNDSYSNFNQGLSAYNWLKKYENPDKQILFYDEMDLGILLTDISVKNRLKFSNKILNNLNEKDINFYQNLLTVYGQHNGSIKNISEELFMHKNTIQYRLNRLHELTGYNPREYNGFLILKLAFLLNSATKT